MGTDFIFVFYSEGYTPKVVSLSTVTSSHDLVIDPEKSTVTLKFYEPIERSFPEKFTQPSLIEALMFQYFIKINT